jgi:DNA-binding NarL/FixJ family response regulator
VLDLVARGHDNRRIARELFLSEKTVRNQVSLLLGKLEVADRAEAIARARRAGLGQEPPS